MNEDTAPHEIARLEAQIEELSAAIERCRKIAFAARIAIAGGAFWFMLALLRILSFDPTFFVGALAATLGGVVLLGSNKTTWEETEAALKQTEATRDALIGAMHLRLVSDVPVTPTLH